MTKDNGMDGPPEEVIDEDGDIDKAIKRRIIKARERVDETEIALYRDAAIEPDVNLNDWEKIHIYATTVKQFLRRIEPIMRSANIDGNERFYKNEHIGSVRLVPPETDGYQFDLVAYSDHETDELRRILDLPRGVNPPEVAERSFDGLQEIIEKEPVVGKRWAVCVKKQGAKPNWEYVYPQEQKPVPKRIYEDAVRKADLFLQSAGIGLDTDTKGTDVITEFDMSGEEPQAEYSVGEYDSNPDL